MNQEYHSQEFKSILVQAKGIAYCYKIVSLYSIPLLTIVTIISMSNVFLGGSFANGPIVANVWAFIFSASIDVNIVRMFVEGYVHKSKTAYVIGVGLGSVTGAALLLEGLQQSIGLSWHNWIVQWVIIFLIGLRVVFVIILMGREGIKLGQLVQLALQSGHSDTALEEPVEVLEAIEDEHLEDVQPEQDIASLINSDAVIDTIQMDTPEQQEIDTPAEHPIVHIPRRPVRRNGQAKRTKHVDPKEAARSILASNPNISARALAAKIGVKSATTASNYIKEIKADSEQQTA